MKTSLRIGVGAGYAGDRIPPAVELAEKGQLDYLVFECLAERTIAWRNLNDPKTRPWALTPCCKRACGLCCRRASFRAPASSATWAQRNRLETAKWAKAIRDAKIEAE